MLLIKQLDKIQIRVHLSAAFLPVSDKNMWQTFISFSCQERIAFDHQQAQKEESRRMNDNNQPHENMTFHKEGKPDKMEWDADFFDL